MKRMLPNFVAVAVQFTVVTSALLAIVRHLERSTGASDHDATARTDS